MAVGGSLLLTLFGLYLPLLRDVLGTAALSPAEVGMAVADGLVMLATVRVDLQLRPPDRAVALTRPGRSG
jgi:Ca2+-transporting ATPase